MENTDSLIGSAFFCQLDSAAGNAQGLTNSNAVIGKPIGILGFVGLAVLLRLVQLPNGVTWGRLVGVSFACGIGFTMSLFIAGLAFEHGTGEYLSVDRLGIVVASLIAAALAWISFHMSLPRSTGESTAESPA